MVKDLTLLTYTNSKAKDLHKVYLDRIEKHFGNIPHFLMNDELIEGQNVFLYNEEDPHWKTMYDSLSKIESDYIIYSQEDYILYNDVNIEKINEYLQILKEDKNISFIRLIYSAINEEGESYNDELFYVNYNLYYYSTQITIWKKSDLMEMFNSSRVEKIWDEPANSPILNLIGKKGLCVKSKGISRGNHHDSLIYPYIATAIVKGKWNMSEYPNELSEIFEEYLIDKRNRDIC